ncbi:MAG: hypothetical protein WC537_01640, partial [Candidatus Paceibacterota bacterium]
ALSTTSDPDVSAQPASATSTSITSFNPVAPLSGDNGTLAYMIPSGASRTFTVNGMIGKRTGDTYNSLRISAINFGTAVGTLTGSRITTGLENLYVRVNI